MTISFHESSHDRSPSRKSKLALIYPKNNPFYTSDYYATYLYHFYMDAMKRHSNLEMVYFPYEGGTFDAFETLRGRGFDAILLSDHPSNPFKIAETLKGIQKLEIPVIQRVGDPHTEIDRTNLHDFWPSYCWGFCPPSYFYKYFPSHLKYEMIIHGLEPSLFQSLTPFKNRIKDRILNSGVSAALDIRHRVRRWIRNIDEPMLKHYRLRSICNKLPYVDYLRPLSHEYIGDRYVELLAKYRAAIAATTTFPTAKYWEIPAAGCLTFMEITEENDGALLGYEDGKNSVFINESNYKDRFEEYLSDPDNPKWERIATAGREYVLSKFSNDRAIDHLIELLAIAEG